MDDTEQVIEAIVLERIRGLYSEANENARRLATQKKEALEIYERLDKEHKRAADRASALSLAFYEIAGHSIHVWPSIK